jgi:hypothetical protein
MKEKMLRLYEDWEKSQDLSVIKKARRALKEATQNPANFTKVVGLMGQDGQRFTQYFNESKSEFSENTFTAKRKASAFILEAKETIEVKPVTELSPDNFKLAYEPMDDRSNRMTSYIEAGTPNGSATEILRAIVGGDMQIAAALTAASWDKLAVGDRNAILNLALTHGTYNQASGVAKDSGMAKFYSVEKKEIKKKGDVSKNEFLAMAFPFSDPQNTKLYKDE